MSRFLVSLLLLYETSLFLQLCNCTTRLLLLLFTSQSPLLSRCQLIHGVLPPVGEVSITLHIALWESEYLERLHQELLLYECVRDESGVVSRMIKEVVRGLCDPVP
jgi:hypothetical protein